MAFQALAPPPRQHRLRPRTITSATCHSSTTTIARHTCTATTEWAIGEEAVVEEEAITTTHLHPPLMATRTTFLPIPLPSPLLSSLPHLLLRPSPFPHLLLHPPPPLLPLRVATEEGARAWLWGAPAWWLWETVQGQFGEQPRAEVPAGQAQMEVWAEVRRWHRTSPTDPISPTRRGSGRTFRWCRQTFWGERPSRSSFRSQTGRQSGETVFRWAHLYLKEDRSQGFGMREGSGFRSGTGKTRDVL